MTNGIERPALDLRTEELGREADGRRRARMTLTIAPDVPHEDVRIGLGGGASRVYTLSVEQVRELHNQCAERLAFMQPMIDAGKVVMSS